MSRANRLLRRHTSSAGSPGPRSTMRRRVLPAAALAVGGGVVGYIGFQRIRHNHFWWWDPTVADTGTLRFSAIKDWDLHAADLTEQERFVVMGRLRQAANAGDTVAMMALVNSYHNRKDSDNGS